MDISVAMYLNALKTSKILQIEWQEKLLSEVC